MSNKKDKQKILNNEVKEEKLDNVSGGTIKNKFHSGQMEKQTQKTLIDYYGYPKK